MAKVVIEADTENGTCSVKVNGKEIPDVTAAGIYKASLSYYGNKDEYLVSATISTYKADEDGVQTYTSITADDKDKAENKSGIEGFRKELSVKNFNKSVNEYMTNYLRKT